MPVLDLIKVDQSKCVKCGLCVADCPACILDMGENGPECNVDRGCMSCGHCVAICPSSASFVRFSNTGTATVRYSSGTALVQV